MSITKLAGTVLCVALGLLLAIDGRGQTSDKSELRGIVFDTSHSVVPKASLTLSNPSTGFRRTVVSDDAGLYVFAQVPAGVYTLTVEAANFATQTVKDIDLHVGASVTFDVTLQLKSQSQTVEVVSASAAIETPTAGISQLINSESVSSLPFPGRDYRDLAQLTPSAQVTVGLRGGIRLGGQQSDYSGISIDGADNYNNSFGEFFGSLETKNFTIPLDAVQEFQVITNGFAPEYGRSTGGQINLITKSGTNDIHGSAFYSYRGDSLTESDALNTPPNITRQQQFGGSFGFPIRKDKQFLFLATQIQRQYGPLLTKFNRSVAGVAVPELGITNLASFEGATTQTNNLYSVLGHYDYQLTTNNHFSIRSFFTRNFNNGFTGGRGQNEVSAAFNNTEHFHNQGLSSVFALNSIFGGNKVNELRVGLNAETRPRHPNGIGPEVQINDTGIFGQRFFLPINGDNSKLQVQDNYGVTFGKHDMKWGGDVDVFQDRKDSFAGWSAGTYIFATLEDFGATPAVQARNMQAPPLGCGHARCPDGFEQGFGLNGLLPFPAGTLFPNYQTGVGLYWQDEWQVTSHLQLTYGLRWDNSFNPQPQSGTPGNEVLAGVGGGSRLIRPPQRIPNDHKQFGPRIGLAYGLGSTHPTTFRAAWGLYYAQTPTIFLPTGGNSKSSTLFCFTNTNPTGAPPNLACDPPTGFPSLFPSILNPNSPLQAFIGAPGISYVDPTFRNPRVSNATVGLEHQFARNLVVSANYAYVHGWDLRTGGFSTTIWSRNVVVNHVDQFGRSILQAANGKNGCPTFGPQPIDCTIGQANALGSFGHDNYHEVVLSVDKRFSNHFQFFANYTWSKNDDNASTERDSSVFFGPEDPFNLNLDYGRSQLDITHQVKVAGVYELPWGFTISGLATAHSGLAYPAYITVDINGDGVSNQGFGTNDRPAVQLGSSKPFLLPRFPARQPAFFQPDLRLSKDFGFGDRYHLQLFIDFFNFTNQANLYSNPDHSAFIDVLGCTADPTPGSAGQVCSALTALPKPGDISTQNGNTIYRHKDQIYPGATAFAAQLNAKFIF